MVAEREMYSVSGGVAGHVAMTEDLSVAVGAICAAADLVREASGRTESALVRVGSARYARVWDDRLGLGGNPVFAARVDRTEGTLSDILAGPTGTRHAEDALLDIADRLRATVAQMEESENAAFRAMSIWNHWVEAGKDFAGLGVEVGSWLSGGLRLAAGGVLRLGTALPLMVPGAKEFTFPETTGFLNRDSLELARGVPASGVSFMAGSLALVTLILERVAKEPMFTRLVEPTGRPPGFEEPTSVEGLVRAMETTWQAGDGSVVIEEIPGPNGPSYVVVIPGTQEMVDFWNATPSDFHSNFEMVAGKVSDSMLAVVAAMEAAGIPADAPVMLVGHSQGGLAAMTLVQHPEFTSRFNVTHVMTAGSPVGNLPTPPGVTSLHLEVAEDITPGVDLQPNANGANQTTLSYVLSASPDPAVRGLAQTIPDAHSFDAYAAAGRVGDSGVSTSVDAFVASASGFLQPTDGTTVTAYRPVTQA